MTAVPTWSPPAREDLAGEMTDPFEQGDRFDPTTVIWVNEIHDLRGLVAAIHSASEVVYDLETSGLDEHATEPVPARVVLAQFTLPQEALPMSRRPPTYLVPLDHPESSLLGVHRAVFLRLATEMRASGKPITGQNLKFDLRWTYAHTGVDLSAQCAWDTRVSSHLLDENTTTSLKPRVAATFGVARWDDHDLSTPGAAQRVPLIDLGMYGARDTYWTWRLAVAHRSLLGVGAEGRDLDPPDDDEEREHRRLGRLAVRSAMPTAATLTEIEQRGMRLDRDWVLRAREARQEVAQIEYDALGSRYGMEGTPSFAPTSLWFQEWAQRAVEAGDLRVAATTPNGRPQWNKDVLTRQARAGSDVAARLLRYREATKQNEFLTAWLGLTTPASEIHPTYNIGRVVTGRLSAENPNVQQITKALKPAFIPRPGYLIAECDFSQIELRVAAFISRCEPMMRAYRTGEDLHRLTASNVLKVPIEQVTKEQRQMAKAVNFGLIYGMGAAGLKFYSESAYGVLMTDEEAQTIRQAYFDTYPELLDWHNDSMLAAQRTGQVVSPIGRIRRLPVLDDHSERQAINSPVQGFAAELTLIAAASIAGHVPGVPRLSDVRLIGTIHDSLVAEVPADDWKRATGRMMRRMIDLAPLLRPLGCDLDVPLGVEASVGTRWGLTDIGVIR